MKRLLAGFFTLCFIMTSCIALSFSASAAGTTIVTTFWHPRTSHNGTNGEYQSYGLADGLYRENAYAKEWEYYSNRVDCTGYNTGSYIDFKFSFVCLLPEVNSGWADYQSSGLKTVTTSDYIDCHCYASKIYELPVNLMLPNNTFTVAKVITFYYTIEVLSDAAGYEQILLDSPFVAYGNGKDCQVFLFDVHIFGDHEEMLNEVLEDILTSTQSIDSSVTLIQPDVATISSIVSSINNQVSFPNYSYYSLSYDSDGIGTGVLLNGNWFTALNGGLRSIGNYLQHHVEIENMAMQTGAMDALDLAMDDADFGALGDFGSIGSIGSWSGSSVGSAGNEGLIEWFSQTTADNLDQASRTRSNDDFVSYYNSHISEILNYGGDDDG